MVYSKGCGLLYQAAPDATLKCPDHPFYLPIGFAVANDDMVVDNAQPFAEPCKAACILGAIIYPDIV